MRPLLQWPVSQIHATCSGQGLQLSGLWTLGVVLGGHGQTNPISALWGGHRWEELHTLASEPREWYVLMAEQATDATNGLFSTLSSMAVCAVSSPGRCG